MIIYDIDRRWLAEEILKLLGGALGVTSIEIETSQLTSLGTIELRNGSVPVYLVRELGNTKVLDDLDIGFRQKHKLGPGIVLAVGENAPRYLGPNVVVRIPSIILPDEDAVIVDRQELQHQFDAKRTLVASAQAAQVIRHGAHAGTLVMPGADALNLTSAHQVQFFEKLVTAAADGTGEVLTKVLMEVTCPPRASREDAGLAEDAERLRPAIALADGGEQADGADAGRSERRRGCRIRSSSHRGGGGAKLIHRCQT